MVEQTMRRLWGAVDRAERAAIVLVMLAMALILVGEVVMREIVGAGVLGGPQLATFLMIWGAYLGYGFATSEGAHMRPRFADGWFPASCAPVVIRVGNVVSCLILSLMGLASIRFVRESFEFGETALALGWATWPAQLILPLAFFLSALRHLTYAAFPRMNPAEGQLAQ